MYRTAWSKPPEDFLAVLNTRSQDIFRKLVERYLDTGTPVASRDLARMLQRRAVARPRCATSWPISRIWG